MPDANLPSTDEVTKALLAFLRPRRRPLSASEVYDPLAEIMKVSGRARLLKRRTTHEFLWNNRVQSARGNLVKQGFTFQQPHDAWRLTDAGRAEADKLEWLKTATPVDLGL
jgi:hypothetical protein